jgi:hypothetical protein
MDYVSGTASSSAGAATLDAVQQIVIGRRLHPDQHVVVADDGHADVLKLQDIIRAIPVVANRLHGVPVTRWSRGVGQADLHPAAPVPRARSSQ